MKKIGKKLYADNFHTRVEIRKDLTGWLCECCLRGYKQEYINAKGKTCKIILIGHHPNHDPENPEAELIILCRACHGKADKWSNADERKQTKLLKELDKAFKAGQLQFTFDETEYTIIQIDGTISEFLQHISLA